MSWIIETPIAAVVAAHSVVYRGCVAQIIEKNSLK